MAGWFSTRARRRGSESSRDRGFGAAAGPTDAGPFGWPAADRDRTAAMQRRMSLWGGDAGVAAIQTRPRLAVAPDLVLRQLGPAPLTADGDWIIEELRALYEAITSGTAALALGDESE